LVGSLNKPERLCAIEIDGHDNVERWIRNPSYASQGGFWLPKSPGRFYPDLIVQLKSGQIVIVEYKNSKLAADPEEQHKRAVGELWAERSDGHCRFAYIIDEDWSTLASKLTP
jgi:type III restriction enzyme